MKSQLYLLGILTMFFAGCTQPDDATTVSEIPSDNVYAVTPDEAANEALAARNALSPSTRASEVAVASIRLIGASTRSGASAPLYLVDFDRDGGFAIVAADKRQPAQLYAVSDSGSFPDPATLETGPLAVVYDRIQAMASSGIGDKTVISVYGPWENTAKLDPMVKVRWGLGKPYNAYTTDATAVAQVMSYYRYPRQYNWTEMVKHVSTRGTAADDYPPAYTLIHNLFAALGTSPYGVALGMGYAGINYNGISHAYALLEEGKPLIINSAPNDEMDYTCAWVVDGYLKQIRYPWISDVDQVRKYLPQQRLLFHCNMCCDGVGNGYYLSDLFNMDAPTIPDAGVPECGVVVDNTEMIINLIYPYEGKIKF